MIAGDTRAIDLTADDLRSMIKEVLAEMLGKTEHKEEEKPQLPEKTYVYGYEGLCDLLHRSRTTIWRAIKSGKLDAAIQQEGRQIRIDADMAVKLYYGEEGNE